MKARAAAASEKNRADLLPLLKSAQLQADRNQPTEASHLFAEILAVEPDWPDALDAQFWFTVIQGDHALNQTTLDEAFGHFQAAWTTVQRLLRAEPEALRSQRDLSISYERIGDVQVSQGDLPSALSSYKQGLEIAQKLAARDPGNTGWQIDLVISLWKLASVLEQQRSPQKREAGAKYQRALEILRPLAVENRLTAEQKNVPNRDPTESNKTENSQ